MVEVRFPIVGLSSEYGDIIVSTVAANVTVAVTIGGMTVLSETYAPDVSGMVYIRDIGKLASLYFSEVNLSLTNGVDGNSVSLVITLTEGATVISKTVKIYRCDADTSGTLTTDELLLKPLTRYSKKITGIGRKEYVSFYSAVTVNIGVCFTTATQDQMTQHTLAPIAADSNFYRFDVSPAVVASLAGITVDQIIYYNVYKSASDIVRFNMDLCPATPVKTFFFRNIFGAQETFTCLGDLMSERSWERERGTINRIQKQVRKDMVRTFTANTGYLTLQGIAAFEDMLNSEMVCVLDNGSLLPIVITEETYKETSRPDEIVSVEFQFRLGTDIQLQYRHNPKAKPGVFDESFDQTFN